MATTDPHDGRQRVTDELFWGNPQAQARFHVGQQVSFHDHLRNKGVDATILAIDWDNLAGPIIVQTDDSAGNEIMRCLPWEITIPPSSPEEIQRYLHG